MAGLKKHRNWVVVGAVFAIALAWVGARSAAAAGEDQFAYVGAKKCKMCHAEAYKSWETTTHAKAFDILKPGERSEAKAKYKLDAAKDYTTDASCLACHTTGYGKTGGYAAPAPADEKAAEKMSKLAGVGCESCHGPGDKYCEIKKEIKKEKRQYTFDELAKAGMTKIEAPTCAACHNEKSPTFEESKKLNFEKMKADEKAIHAHQPLTLRKQ